MEDLKECILLFKDALAPPPWNRPNWRDVTQYPDPYPDFIQKGKFAWEFLRRNPIYQEDFRRLFQHPHAIHATCYTINGIRCGFHRFVEDNGLLGPFPIHCEVYHGADARGFNKLHQEILGKYGLEDIVYDPETPFSICLKNTRVGGFPSAPTRNGCEQKIWCGPYEMPFIFDISLNLDEQLEKAKISLKQFQKSFYGKNPGRTKYQRLPEQLTLYLRILDADDSRAKNKVIGELLLPHVSDTFPSRIRSKAIDKDRKAARKLRDKDYKLLMR